MSLPIQPYKGARDFYPEDKRLQKYMFRKIRQTVEQYGYEEIDAPILEPLELYAAKSGEEIVNEQTYAFEDRGGRKVTIRPEWTPTVSRMVAGRRQELSYPLRWYSIPNLWRYERPQRGRLREHWQLNVDVFGLADLTAEHELIILADAIFKSFKARPSMYEFRINSRQLIDYVLNDYLRFDHVQAHSLIKLIDRMHKLEPALFESQLDAICTPSQRENGTVNRLLSIVRAASISDLPVEVQLHESVRALEMLLGMLSDVGINNARFDPGLMRGFDYYTGVVFEVFDLHPDNNRSLFGGGRYDGLVGLFGVEPLPTVGFGMGDVTLQDFLQSHNLLPELSSETDAYVVLIGAVYGRAQHALQALRAQGLRIAVDATGRKLDKAIKAAEKKAITTVIFIGERELEDEMYVLKNLQTGHEERHGAARTISIIKDYRKK